MDNITSGAARSLTDAVFDNSLRVTSAGFLGGDIQNSKPCGQALSPFFLSYFLSPLRACLQARAFIDFKIIKPFIE